jgi:hypothetical protein
LEQASDVDKNPPQIVTIELAKFPVKTLVHVLPHFDPGLGTGLPKNNPRHPKLEGGFEEQLALGYRGVLGFRDP